MFIFMFLFNKRMNKARPYDVLMIFWQLPFSVERNAS